ncbi:unnamed protein product [Fusarium graminearum]|uniref:Chromosome 1, complete genome n=1 Tax=Gibberella zeae (strain ATCC MYA-4620 / CBS 123657 / FGSC 9075 / NRRL 31084 / PH-1) TaxID=229533 RepID=A0A098CZH1_GIBZE|nr:unnamed protein product [Fusarium graminearum]
MNPRRPLPVANGNVTTTPTRAFVTEDIEKPRFKHTLSERWTRKKKRNSPSPGLEPGSFTPRRASRFNTYPFSMDVLPLHQLGLLRCCSFNLCISYCG